MPQAQEPPAASKLRARATVAVGLAPNSNLESIQKVIAEIGRLNGCLPCGLLGSTCASPAIRSKRAASGNCLGPKCLV